MGHGYSLLAPTKVVLAHQRVVAVDWRVDLATTRDPGPGTFVWLVEEKSLRCVTCVHVDTGGATSGVLHLPVDGLQAGTACEAFFFFFRGGAGIGHR